MIALIAFGTFVYVDESANNGDLSNSSNVTTFFERNKCVDNLSYFQCDQFIKNDDAALSLCYAAAYGVSRLTYPDGD